MNKEYDPELKKCAEELKVLFKKYDVMGSVTIASPSHSEFLMHVEATWSVSKWEGDAIRFRSKKEDWPSKAAQDKATEATVHGIESIRWLNAKMHDNMSQLIEMLREKMTIMTNVGQYFDKPKPAYPKREKITKTQVQAISQVIGGMAAMLAGLDEVDLSLGRRADSDVQWSMWTRSGHRVTVKITSDGGLVASKSSLPDEERPTDSV